MTDRDSSIGALSEPEEPAWPPLNRDRRRSMRKRVVRARTISVKRMTLREIREGRRMYPDDEEYRKPATRGECQGGPRPCPFVSCTFNLYLDIQPKTGAIKLNFPDLEPEDMAESCALDVADRGGVNLEEVGACINVTRERVRQLEVSAVKKIHRNLEAMAILREHEDLAAPRTLTGKRRLRLVHSEETAHDETYAAPREFQDHDYITDDAENFRFSR